MLDGFQIRLTEPRESATGTSLCWRMKVVYGRVSVQSECDYAISPIVSNNVECRTCMCADLLIEHGHCAWKMTKVLLTREGETEGNGQCSVCRHIRERDAVIGWLVIVPIL